MKPVKAPGSNVLYKGPSSDIGDLWVRRVQPGVVRSTWEPDEQERQLLAEGGRIQLTIWREPISPVALRVVSSEDSKPIGKHGWKVDLEPGDKIEEGEEDDEEDEFEHEES